MGVASIGDWSRRTLDTIPGQPPAAGEEMPGCRFAPRCRYAAEECVSGPVPLLTVDRRPGLAVRPGGGAGMSGAPLLRVT